MDPLDPKPDRPRRVQIEHVKPEIDGGRFPVRRALGDRFDVSADVFADGHDILAGRVLHRPLPSPADPNPPWSAAPLSPSGKPDGFRASFVPTSLGFHQYAVEAWIDDFATFRRDLEKRVAAGLDVAVDLLDGAALLARVAARAEGEDARSLAESAARLADGSARALSRVTLALETGLAACAARYPDPETMSHYPGMPHTLELVVAPEKARSGAWYEMFPRSASTEPRHGTFADVEARLPYVAGMGFDVLYLPPIHPIGWTNRKGKNGALVAALGDPGSPWAIGDASGGFTEVHPALGTLDDFDRLLSAAKHLGIDIALDIAFQASPDHPWVQEHPAWFTRRADGSLRHAENPPKTYRDVHPFDFETAEFPELWRALRGVFVFWIERGVRFFRVDNPHTKPLPFWEWCIRSLKREHPDTVFLAEAFTRPAVALGLAKRGFDLSYTYFTWRVDADEIQRYLDELCHTEIAEYFWPSFWPNTPDILPEHLQTGTRATFLTRLVLAATLSSSYGIYGPPFELLERAARPGTEEYEHSEKFEIRTWDLDKKESLRPVLETLNRIRKEHPALRRNASLRFFPTGDDHVLCYAKTSADLAETIVVAVNLDPAGPHNTWVELDLPGLTDSGRSFEVEELLLGGRRALRGRKNRVEIDPARSPALVFAAKRRARKETDFEYYL